MLNQTTKTVIKRFYTGTQFDEKIDILLFSILDLCPHLIHVLNDCIVLTIDKSIEKS